MGSPAGKGAKPTKRHKLIRAARHSSVRSPVRAIGNQAGRKSIVRGKNTAAANIRQAGKAGPDILVP